jgi:3-deoxy-manno-octulosonate cytidylyltransferase (CMP-KDO synthetase)
VSFYIVIPARYDSVRLPGKVLRVMAGRTMLQHVFERAQATSAKSIIIATDDQRIADTAIAFGADICMTSSKHVSGTHRIGEVIQQRQIPAEAVVVNLQGDEPLMPASCVSQVAELLMEHKEADVATLSMPIHDEAGLSNSNMVKVVRDKGGYALYFSRACIPCQRDQSTAQREMALQTGVYQRHIGIYAYRAGYVSKYADLTPSPYEELEKLEQLRVLWHGGRIVVAQATQNPGPGVDTEEELHLVESLLQKKHGGLK